MIPKLVYENVRHRPMRTLLSILLIGVPVTLILTLVGLSQGVVEDSVKRSNGIGADIVVRAPGTSLMSFSGAAIPEKLVGALAKEPHVTIATGTVNHVINLFDNLTGVDLKTFSKMSGGLVYDKGRGFERPNEIDVDTYYARQRKLRVGDTINLLNRDWRVAGIVEPGKLAHIFLPIQVLQDLTGNTGKVSQIYLKVDDPKNIPAAVARLKRRLEGYPIYPMSELASLISVDNVPWLKSFINVVIGIGVVIGFAVVSLSMYMAVLQRTREIGILKSLGASRWFVLEIILAEAFLLGLGGTIFGIFLSFLTRWALRIIVPASLPQAIVFTWWPIAGLIAVGAALLGAVYPGLIAVRQDPIEALAYE
ncbi:MAG: ABC transporter permease [Acidobacteriota bacterium]|nr:ABC transporter permease [Acidobacteriota bacterium]